MANIIYAARLSCAYSTKHCVL